MIKQCRGCLNGVSYCWSGFGFVKWMNVRSILDLVITRNETEGALGLKNVTVME